MPNQNHTPFKIVGRSIHTRATDPRSKHKDKTMVVANIAQGWSDAEARDIARFMVRACNAHDGLLEALKRITRTSVKETFHGNVEDFQEWLDAFSRDALAKAAYEPKRPGLWICPECGRDNAFVNQCWCDPDNLPTRIKP